jgi:subtilisin-like proprotein convertase family protein
MKKPLLLILVLLLNSVLFSQSKNWTKIPAARNLVANKNVNRSSFPKVFELYQMNLGSLVETLKNAPQKRSNQASNVIIEVPSMDGKIEHYKVYEFSNFAPALQAQFPNIRSYVGQGMEDKTATIRFSVDPSGFQAMILKGDRHNVFIEPYSEDSSVYAVYESTRNKGSLPFICSTEESVLAHDLSKDMQQSTLSNSGELLEFRLALSCNGEYTAYFGGTVANALAAMNTTMTRVNGVFEIDLAIHMNIIDNNTSVIYTNAATDPYTSMGSWNGQLQSTLTSVIGEANYDIGHMFGATGGGGNAGCIGCVCVNGSKGSGITSPADGIPMGDNFDIDYVAHEMGHQFGGNHTFSNSVEGTGVNVEPGSGSTIMGYAGITSQDVQLHSDAYFVYASVKQIQDNMVGKTCPVRTTLTNVAPLVNAGLDYTIPKSTPFILDGSATDANGDVLTYCWEENDSATSQTGANSAASATKTGGPNWRSYNPVATTQRFCPPIERVVANASTTQGLDIVVEALSAVARPLNFVLTARDNIAGGGQTGSDAMLVTVNATAGPFLVTVPNTNVDWPVGTSQDVTWDVAGTTANNVNAAAVDIFLSTDGGYTYPIVLATNVPNDGLETITVPNAIGTANRIMVKGNNHIFYDISNTNFIISEPLTDFTIAPIGGYSLQTCTGIDATKDILFTTYQGFSADTQFTTSGAPAGAIVAFSPNPINTTGIVTMAITNTAAAAPGLYPIVVTATSGSIVKTFTLQFQVYSATFATTTLTAPANLATGLSSTVTLSWTADANATSYDVEVATDAAFTTITATGNTSATSYVLTGLANQTDFYWRIKPKNASCEGAFSEAFLFTTGNEICNTVASANVPLTIATTANVTINSTLNIPDNLTITDVDVIVDITHSWVNDLTITLISPTGTQVQLVNRPCANSALNNVVATFNDGGIPLVCGNNPAIGGEVKPTQVLSALNGQNSSGTWTLRVKDSANQDGGTLNSWSLKLCGIQNPLGVVSNTITNLAVYPNPNHGNFNVQFNSLSNNPIKLGVYDMRGRTVFANNYQNNGYFNENLQLDNLQTGVYLLKVMDGDIQTTKKIIIE